jgi:hypothetical protein
MVLKPRNSVLIRRRKFGYKDIQREECNVKTEAKIEMTGLMGMQLSV